MYYVLNWAREVVRGWIGEGLSHSRHSPKTHTSKLNIIFLPLPIKLIIFIVVIAVDNEGKDEYNYIL